MWSKVQRRLGGVFTSALLFGSCTTAELAVDLAKKYQNNLTLKDSAKMASGANIARPEVIAAPVQSVSIIWRVVCV